MSDDLPFGSQGGALIRYHFPLDARVHDQGPAAAPGVRLHHRHGRAAPARRPAGRRAPEAVHGGRRSEGHDDAREFRRQHAGRSGVGRLHAHRRRGPRGARPGEGRASTKSACRSSGGSGSPKACCNRRRPGSAAPPTSITTATPRWSSCRLAVPTASPRAGRLAEPPQGLRLPSEGRRGRGAVRAKDSVDARDARLSAAGRPRATCRRCSVSTGRAGAQTASTPASSEGSSASWPLRASCSASSASPQRLAPGSAYRLSDLDLASRLSFFLWSSIPDDELLRGGGRGKLKDPAVLEQQVRRMLRDPRSNALVDNFASRWLELSKLAGVVPDTELYPEFDENLREAMEQETQLFVAQPAAGRPQRRRAADRRLLVRERAAGEALWDSRHLRQPFPARHVRRRRARRPARPGQHPDGDVVSQSDVGGDARHAGCWRTCSARRRRRRRPTCPRSRTPARTVSRGRCASAWRCIGKNPVCASCHQRMDPLGFALENFDAVGKWRTASDGAPIDAVGVVAGRHHVRRRRRAARAAGQPQGRFRPHAQREAAGLCDRPRRRLSRPAGGPQDRARRGAGRLLAGRRSSLGIVKSAPFSMGGRRRARRPERRDQEKESKP